MVFCQVNPMVDNKKHAFSILTDYSFNLCITSVHNSVGNPIPAFLTYNNSIRRMVAKALIELIFSQI